MFLRFIAGFPLEKILDFYSVREYNTQNMKKEAESAMPNAYAAIINMPLQQLVVEFDDGLCCCTQK